MQPQINFNEVLRGTCGCMKDEESCAYHLILPGLLIQKVGWKRSLCKILVENLNMKGPLGSSKHRWEDIVRI